MVLRTVRGPLGGRGIQDQFCDHFALSSISFQGIGVNGTATAAPSPRVKKSRLVSPISISLVTAEAARLDAFLAMAVLACAHG